MAKGKGLDVLISLQDKSAENQALVKKLVRSIQEPLKKIGVKMSTEDIIKSFTAINAQIDKTTGKASQLNAVLQLASGRTMAVNANVGWDTLKSGKNKGQQRLKNVEISTISEHASVNKEANKYLSLTDKIVQKRKQMNSLIMKGESLTENEAKTLKELNSQVDKLMSQREKSRKLLVSSGTDMSQLDAKVIHKEQEAVYDARRKSDAAHKKATKEQADIDKKNLNEYITREKEILGHKKTIYDLEAKANSSFAQKTIQNKNALDIQKRKVSELESEQSKMRAGYTKDSVMHREMLKHTELRNQKESELLSLSKAQYAINKSVFRDMMSGWKEAVARIVNYTVVYRSLWGIIKGFQSGVQTIVNLNKAFTDIQMVTGYTDSQVQSLSKSYIELAKNMGATVDQVASGATEWLRQGKTVSETTKLIEQSMILSKVGAMESAEATEYLTSTLNGYKMEVEDASRIVDVFSKLDMSAATSSKELAIAFSRTANSAKDAGMPFEELAGYITTVSETTRRSASTVGEAFKTIFARIQNVKVGKVIDDETGEAINDTEKALATLGIALRNNENEWRDAKDVMEEVGKKWSTYNDLQKNTIVTSLAGTRQAEILRAAFNNFDKVLEYTNEAYESGGSAAEKYSTYLDSVEAKTNKLITTFQEIAYQPQFEELYKQFLDLGIGLGEFLKVVLSSPATINALVGGLSMLAAPAIWGGVFTAFKGLVDYGNEINALGGVMNSMPSKFKNTVMAFEGLTFAEQSAIISTKAMTVAEMEAALTKRGLDAATKSNTLAILAENLAMKSSIPITQSLSLALKGMAMTLLTNPATYFIILIGAIWAAKGAYDKYNVTLEEHVEIVNKTKDSIQSLQTEYDSLISKTALSSDEKERLEILTAELAIQEDLLKIQEEQQKKAISDKYLGKGSEQIAPGYFIQESMRPEESLLDKENNKIDEYNKKQREIFDLKKSISEYEQANRYGSIKRTEEETKAYAENIEQLKILEDAQANSKKIMMDTYKILLPAKGVNSEIDTTIKLLEKLLGIIPNVDEEFENAFKSTKSLFETNNILVQKYINKYKEYTEEQKQSQIELTKVTIQQIKNRMLGYSLELEALNSLASSGDLTAEGDYRQAQIERNIKNQSSNLINAQSELEALESLISSSSEGYPVSTESSESTKETAIEAQNLTKELINAFNAQVELDKIQAKGLERQIKNAEEAEDYAKAIELQNKLLENQKKTIDDLGVANQKIHEEANKLRAGSKYGAMSESWFDINGEASLAYKEFLNSFAGKTDEASKQAVKDIEALWDSIYQLKQGWRANANSILEYQDAIVSTTQKIKDLIVEQKQAQIDAIQWKIDDLNYAMANDKRISRIKSQIEAYQDLLDAQEFSKEAEKEKTEEIQKQKDLIDSLKKQKDIRVYRADKGWTWEADKSKIADEEENLKQLEQEYANWKIQKAINKLQDRLDSITNSYEKQIESLQLMLENEQYNLALMQRKGTTFGSSMSSVFMKLISWVNRLQMQLSSSSSSSTSSGSSSSSGSGSSTSTGGSSGSGGVIGTITGIITNPIGTIGGLLNNAKANDSGGLNYGKGLMLKDVVEPERVLSPEQTQSFEKLINYMPKALPTIEALSNNISPIKNSTSTNSNSESIVIEKMTINAPNGATFESLLSEAKNLSKMNKK